MSFCGETVVGAEKCHPFSQALLGDYNKRQLTVQYLRCVQLKIRPIRHTHTDYDYRLVDKMATLHYLTTLWFLTKF